ncbi:hypothetical protein V8C40DRAFT_271133 [Trichoderma camerunense]
MAIWLEIAADAGVARSIGNGDFSKSSSLHCQFLIYLRHVIKVGNIAIVIVSTIAIIL